MEDRRYVITTSSDDCASIYRGVDTALVSLTGSEYTDKALVLSLRGGGQIRISPRYGRDGWETCVEVSDPSEVVTSADVEEAEER